MRPIERSGSHQRGQILPIVAGGMIALLAIAALVTDLGFSWMLRRQEQNAADAGAVAAARHIPAATETDSGVLAALREKRWRAACYYARLNGFFESATDDSSTSLGCVPANDSGNATLTVNYPPVGTTSGSYGGRPGFVQVIISREHPAFFGRIFGRSVDKVTTAAVAANTQGASNSNSLVALDPTTCASGKISGNNTQVNIHPAAGVTAPGGYVHINSICGNENSPPDSPNVNEICGSGEGSGALKIDSSGSSLTAPQVNVRGTCIKSSSNTFSAPLDEGAGWYDDPLAYLTPPDVSMTGPGAECGVGTGNFTSPTGAGRKGCNFGGGGGGPPPTPSPMPTPSPTPLGTPSPTASPPPPCSATATVITVEPGTYYGGWNISNNVEIRMKPGMYIMAGGGISLQAGGCLQSVSGDPSVDARVFIYNTDNPVYAENCKDPLIGGASFECQGAVDFTANTTFNAKAPNNNTCLAVPSVCPYRGILIWHDGKGSCQYDPSCDVSLGGQTSLNISGTIYAPTALVTLSGGSSGTGVAAVQIISWQWEITGGATLDMPYDPSELYKLEQKGLVH
ncbi:MAG TPA: pilus assembly protein TadG-related protein [Candidatus Limnocylindrales bacterium]|nr:pilus assembly protein TadG-related protein [Candidatus Limnocylindrales bacterium]